MIEKSALKWSKIIMIDQNYSKDMLLENARYDKIFLSTIALKNVWVVEVLERIALKKGFLLASFCWGKFSAHFKVL